jgi:hypothetical protein
VVISDDYENREFGWFRIMEKFGSGAEAEVFQCHHVPTGRVYVLRLHVEDDEVWERAEPMLPPRNCTIEHANARGTVISSQFYYDYTEKQTGEDWKFVAAELFGVRDNKYLIPISNVYQRPGAIKFEQLLNLPLPLEILPFWESIGLLAQAETGLLKSGSIPIEKWRERWGFLLQDALVRQWINDPMADLSPQLRSAVEASLSKAIIIGPSLEKSAVARIMVARMTKTVTKEELATSLSCPFFRMNITLRDLEYTIRLLRLYTAVPWLIQDPIEWLGSSAVDILLEIANGLASQPYRYPEDKKRFKKCSPPSEEVQAGYDLILQDLAASRQQFLSLERS